MNLKLGFIIKHTINIVISILLIISVFTIFNLNKKNAEMNTNNDMLSGVVTNKEDTIHELTNRINELTNINTDLNNKIEQANKTNEALQKDNVALESEIQKLLVDIEELEEKLRVAEEKINVAPVLPPYRDFKSYMSYKAINSQSSVQWQLQQQATTNEDGIRCINGIPMVAVGTGWGLSVGDIALVTCDNGNSFTVMIGDIKSDAHTDMENKTTMSNGCRCEFIVETDKLDTKVRIMGSMTALDKYKGYVVNITKAN